MGQISGDQIVNGTVTNSDLSSPLNLPTAQLQDGAEFVKRNGSVALTGNANLGGNKGTNAANGTASSDLATKGQMDTAIAAAIASLTSKLFLEIPPDPVNGTNKAFQAQYLADGSPIFPMYNGVFYLPDEYTQNGTTITLASGVAAPASPGKIALLYIHS